MQHKAPQEPSDSIDSLYQEHLSGWERKAKIRWHVRRGRPSLRWFDSIPAERWSVGLTLRRWLLRGIWTSVSSISEYHCRWSVQLEVVIIHLERISEAQVLPRLMSVWDLLGDFGDSTLNSFFFFPPITLWKTNLNEEQNRRYID